MKKKKKFPMLKHLGYGYSAANVGRWHGSRTRYFKATHCLSVHLLDEVGLTWMIQCYGRDLCRVDFDLPEPTRMVMTMMSVDYKSERNAINDILPSVFRLRGFLDRPSWGSTYYSRDRNKEYRTNPRRSDPAKSVRSLMYLQPEYLPRVHDAGGNWYAGVCASEGDAVVSYFGTEPGESARNVLYLMNPYMYWRSVDFSVRKSTVSKFAKPWKLPTPDHDRLDCPQLCDGFGLWSVVGANGTERPCRHVVEQAVTNDNVVHPAWAAMMLGDKRPKLACGRLLRSLLDKHFEARLS